jgi:hypothetical protein
MREKETERKIERERALGNLKVKRKTMMGEREKGENDSQRD